MSQVETGAQLSQPKLDTPTTPYDVLVELARRRGHPTPDPSHGVPPDSPTISERYGGNSRCLYSDEVQAEPCPRLADPPSAELPPRPPQKTALCKGQYAVSRPGEAKGVRGTERHRSGGTSCKRFDKQIENLRLGVGGMQGEEEEEGRRRGRGPGTLNAQDAWSAFSPASTGCTRAAHGAENGGHGEQSNNEENKTKIKMGASGGGGVEALCGSGEQATVGGRALFDPCWKSGDDQSGSYTSADDGGGACVVGGSAADGSCGTCVSTVDATDVRQGPRTQKSEYVSREVAVVFA